MKKIAAKIKNVWRKASSLLVPDVLQGLAHQQRGHTAGELDHLDAALHVAARFDERLAMLARVAADDVLKIFVHQHLETAKNPRAFDRRRFHPRGERGMRGLDGGVCVREISNRTFRNHFADGRIENGCARGFGFNPFAADEIGTRFKCFAHNKIIFGPVA